MIRPDSIAPIRSFRRRAPFVVGFASLLAFAACKPIQMYDQAYHRPLSKSNFFADQTSYRTPPAGTVARGQLREDDHLYTGKIDGQLAATFPIHITKEVLDRGETRYTAFCAPCHGRLGDGNGMIVQRGLKQPPSFHEERLRTVAVGHFFDVITNGFGVMYDYKDRIAPEDRWAIVAYIQALQLSQNATVTDVPEAERGKLQ